MLERLKKIRQLAHRPMKDDKAIRRVEVIILKFQEEPSIINECVSRVIHNTVWPFKLNIYDNRLNTPNTAKIWNKLMREATCPYVCFLDSDAFIPEGIRPCWLTRLMESIEETGIVVPMGDNVGGANKATEAVPYPAHHFSPAVWSGFCFLLKKEIWKELGGFEERFLLYGQDSEFAYRASKKAKGAVYRSDVFVRHIGSYSAKKLEEEGGLDREADKMYANTLYRLLREKGT